MKEKKKGRTTSQEDICDSVVYEQKRKEKNCGYQYEIFEPFVVFEELKGLFQ